ncbi:acyltransferase family protein [Paenibacillus tengchongensis]|uniref:acyltransferase family protein n=1 Tax=Paenibacillus tengchongensis TaxID=2608684 RepID=UPI00124D5B62|nr:acyltransferase family protein [Paenibacillus tengchongensis]
MAAFAGIRACFGNEKINTGRQPELDLAKGCAILFMVWTHVFDELSPDSQGILVTLVRNILGGPFAAPVFMICLGIGVSYSRNNSPKDLMKRGFSLLGIGLLLNIFRYVLPDLAKYAITHESTYLYHTFSLFSVDILQFAGLAFLFLALLTKLKLNNLSLLIIGVVASLLGTVLRGVSTGNYVGDQFIGFIWGTASRSYFPFLNWLIFPISGLVFGSLLKHCTDKKSFYLRIAPICIGLTTIYLILTIRFGIMFSSAGSYYFLGLLDAVFFMVLAVGFFGLNYAILQMLPAVSFQPLIRWSKNINAIYCIHWSLIGVIGILMQLLIKSSALPFWQATLIATLLLLISDQIAIWYLDKLKPYFMRRL